MAKLLEKFGDYYLNPNHIVEMKFTEGNVDIYLSNGVVRGVGGAQAKLLKEEYLPKEPTGGSNKTGGKDNI